MSAALPELDSFDKNTLTDVNGRSFKEFRRTLTPRFLRVWTDVIGGHVALALSCSAVTLIDARLPAYFPLTALLGGLAIGYVIAYIQLFFHEAAHYNIARHRGLNDFLANLLIGLMVGQNIKAYRLVHFDHHRHLGTPDDTERSYFDALTPRFILESLTGIKLVKILLRRRRYLDTRSAGDKSRPSGRLMLLSGLVANLCFIGACVWTRNWALALAWPLGMGVVHPFVNAVRQLLEHRSFEARSSIDYAEQSHGPVTRMFGSGPISSTLGGAGFNRHLLHHWDPQLSYTRFAELEAFLLETPAGGTLRRSRVSYAGAFKRLIQAP